MAVIEHDNKPREGRASVGVCYFCNTTVYVEPGYWTVADGMAFHDDCITRDTEAEYWRIVREAYHGQTE